MEPMKPFFMAIVLVAVLFVSGCAGLTKEVNQMGEISISSPAFANNGMMPIRYTCRGDNVNPELDIADVPEDASSLVLIMDDPDAPMGTWVHWILFNMIVMSRINGHIAQLAAQRGQRPERGNAGKQQRGKERLRRAVPAIGNAQVLLQDIRSGLHA